MHNEDTTLRQRKQLHPDNDHASGNDTVVLTRQEYEKLKLLESTAQKYDFLKKIVIWGVFILFIIAITMVIQNKITENEARGIKMDSYYNNDIDRARKEVETNIGNKDLKFSKFRNNFRVGRLYHRGGNYGQKANT
ncbi:hypothetical protein C6P40_004294 [Pichia californica]|uniref:Uncharacterized protein n=1 Tax=Pichia californica TaxID=460514 RepID=A0A9P7BHD3_9ASCO|nr:hypothetical protein C6P42_003794 [[Candida] californica]KAG0689884.1 hypothetical protein C6P40_004294 [[Candida] californica]